MKINKRLKSLEIYTVYSHPVINLEHNEQINSLLPYYIYNVELNKQLAYIYNM